MTRQFSSIHRTSYSALAFALAAAATSPAWAQTTEEKPALDTVVVVAQKREQTAQDVPVALSVLSAAALDRAQIEDATDGDNITNFIIEDALIGRYRNVRLLEPRTFGVILEKAF
jgi:outer membrane receptor protein involved in Fe transport